MAKACPGKNVTPQPLTKATVTVEAESVKTSGRIWKDVVTQGRKSTADPSPQNDVPPKQQKPSKEYEKATGRMASTTEATATETKGNALRINRRNKKNEKKSSYN